MEHPNQYFQGPRYPFRPWRPPRLGRPLFKNASSPNWRMDGPCYPAPYPDFRFYSNHPPNFWQAPRRFPFQNSGWTHPRPLTPLMQCTPWDIHSTPFQPPNDLSTIQRLPKSAEDKAYSAFLKATKLTSQSVHTLSQNDILNKQVFEILKIMCDYKDTVNNFQFLIRLLRQQEFYPEGEPSKRVKLIMVFVRLVRGLKLVQKLKSDTISVKSKGEIDRIIKYFTDVFNKTLEQVKSQKLCSVAATHLKILQSVKIECSEIGLNIRPFGDADKGLEDLQKQKRTSREIIRTPDNSVLLQDEPEKYEKTPDDSTIDSPIPVWEPVYQPVNDEEMSLWESDQTLLDQIKKTKSAPICANPSTRKISKPAHNFDEEQLKLIQQFVESRNELLQQDSSKKSEKCSKYVKTIHQLVSVFIKSRRIGLGHKDSEYLQVLLQDEVALTNTGRKACLWALCLILENTDSPPNLSFTDAENLDCLIGNMDIQRCNIKWCTIELLAIRNRLRRYLDQDFLSSLESFLSRLTVQKYKIVDGSSVNLGLTDFYPRNTPALKKMKRVVLAKIPKVDDVLALCKQELNKFHAQMNMKKAEPPEPPDIVCLGTPFRPPPEVVTLDSGSDSDDDE